MCVYTVQKLPKRPYSQTRIIKKKTKTNETYYRVATRQSSHGCRPLAFPYF